MSIKRTTLPEISPEISKDDVRFPWNFFVLIFALSVPFWFLDAIVDVQLLPGLPISSLMILSTLTAAILFAARRGGWIEVRKLLARSADFNQIRSLRWFITAVLLMPAIFVIAYASMRVLGMPVPDPQITWSSIPILALMFLAAATCEELAWSATALEPIQLRWGAVSAAAIIGVVWSVWHLIPFIQSGNDAGWIIGQMLFLVVFRGIIVWLYNQAGRVISATILCHASYNVGWQLFPNHGSAYNPWIATVISLFVLLVLIGRSGWFPIDGTN